MMKDKYKNRMFSALMQILNKKSKGNLRVLLLISKYTVVGQKHVVSLDNMVVNRCRCETVEAAKFNVKEQDN